MADLTEAYAIRRRIMGDAYVDGQQAPDDPVMSEFQDHLTASAWGVWARSGALTPRDRSLLVLAMTAALGRMDEFRLHLGTQANTGVTDDELNELLFQIAAYCGVPAGVQAKKALSAVRSQRTAESTP